MKDQTEMDLGVKFKPPSLLEVIAYGALHQGLPSNECEKFHSYYSANGWKVGRNPMKSWHSALDHWKLLWQQRQKPKTVWELKTVIEAKQKLAEELKRSSTSEVATGTTWKSKQIRNQYYDLLRQIKDLTEKLASM